MAYRHKVMTVFFKRWYFEKIEKSLASWCQRNRHIRNIVWPNSCYINFITWELHTWNISFKNSSRTGIFDSICFTWGRHRLQRFFSQWYLAKCCHQQSPSHAGISETNQWDWKRPQRSCNGYPGTDKFLLMLTHTHSTLLPPSLNSSQSRQPLTYRATPLPLPSWLALLKNL